MSKMTNKLPDSLELLLDTMCNTFGGIMFIALSLVIISQMVTDKIVSKTPEKIPPEKIRVEQLKVEHMQKEIKALEAENASQKAALGNVSAEQHRLIKEIAQANKENDAIKEKNQKISEEIKKLQQEIAAAIKKLNNLRREKNILADKTKQPARNQQQKVAELQKEVNDLKKQLAKTKGKTIRFSQEKSTGLSQYFIFLKNGKLYRLGDSMSPIYGEVRMQEYGRQINIIMLSGHSFSSAQQLDPLFANVSSYTYFISLHVDNNSFDSLLLLRRYLRSKKYKVYWTYNPEYSFVRTNHVDSRASD